MAATGTSSKAVPGRTICQTRITPLRLETPATLKLSVACRLEFHLKAERRGAFRHPEACPCHPLRLLTLASMAVRCVGSAVAETSVVLPLAVAVSAAATALVVVPAGAVIVSVAAEATATGKGAQAY